MKLARFLLTVFQCGLIGWSAYWIASGVSPVIFGIHVGCIAVNLMFGVFNAIMLVRED